MTLAPPSRTPRPAMQRITGLNVSGGIGIGRAVVVENRPEDVYRLPIAEDAVDEELARFVEAVEQTRAELSKLRDRACQDMGDQLGAIFDAHLLFLADPGFLGQITDRIRQERVNVEWAVHRTAESYSERFAALGDEYIRERQADLTDVVTHLLHRLQGISHHDLSELEGPLVIVADDLTPSDALRLGRERVVGFALETGGRTSHTTIVARSLRVPTVSGLGEVTSLVTDEDPVIIDGEEGEIILHPTAEVLADYRRRIDRLETRESEMLATRDLEACTQDRVDVALMANIDLAEELDDIPRYGAAGVGLYRSEFLYIEKSPALPSEDEHLDTYRRIIEAAAPHPAIIRTFDLGGRKLAQEMLDTREENPVLGLRGIRLTLARPEFFKVQLRALYRAGLHGDLWVMMPLVSCLEEVDAFRRLADEVERELTAEGVPHAPSLKLGVMIEVPSAAMIADRFARRVDFLSLGTNDLIQYSLAVDRNNEQVASLYQPLHPAILRMLKHVIRSGREAGIEVSLCGEMAADPRLTPVLVGLGLRRMSVAPRSVPAVKTRLRSLEVDSLEALMEQCLDLDTAAEVEALLAEALPGMGPRAAP